MNYYNENDPKAAAWLRELVDAGEIPEGKVDERSITDVIPSDLEGYDQCHFFAGIGGWSYALSLADWPVGEKVWTGSCPCQPFSVAGKGGGEADERHLWPDFLRLIQQCSPPVVFGEQVASKAGKVWLARVRADLEALGYGVGGADLCAAGLSAPHIRQRLYWVADTYEDGRGEARRSRPRRQEPDAQHSGSLGGLAQPRQQQPRRGYNRPGESAIANEGRAPSKLGRPSDTCGLAYPERDGGRTDESQWETEGGAVDGRASRLADVQQQQGLEGLSGNGDPRNEPGRLEAQSIGPTPTCGSASWVDNTTNVRALLAGSAQPKSVRQNHGILRSPSGMGDTESGGRGVVGDETLAGSGGHPLFASWSRFELIYCRDNKTRRIESGTFPLAHGIPGRVGLLRGYGNAIVPQVAAEFIGAYLDL